MKVSIVSIARLEDNYINEWISHNLKIGIDHIYIYDNSFDGECRLFDIIFDEYKNNVTIIEAYNKKEYQKIAYKDAYDKYGFLYDYMIFIDIDEFIMLQLDDNIKIFLERLPNDLQCYRINWQTYDDNDLIERDVRQSVVKDFIRPVNKFNRVSKSIIKCGIKNVIFYSSHYAVINKDSKSNNLITYYGSLKYMEDCDDRFTPDIDYTFIKLNHYRTKSLSEYIDIKMRRGTADKIRDYYNFDHYFKTNVKTDEKIEYINTLKNKN